MLIAHAPAGYIINHTFNKSRKTDISFLKLGLLFSVWPDFDLIYFYFFDKTSTFHHLYFPHLPIVLLLCVLFVLPLRRIKRFQKLVNIYYLFMINWFVHLLLDTVTGGIAWFYPFSSEIYKMIDIPATHSNWVLSFIFHWSFLIELLITVSAILIALKAKRVEESPN